VKIKALHWSNGVLEMIDQRVLPASFTYLPCTSAASVAEGIRSMVVRGAPAIGVAAAYGVALEALRLLELDSESFQNGIDKGLSVLAQSRPTAINLFWALARMKRLLESIASESNACIAARLLAEAHAIFAEDIRINRAIGAHGADLLQDGASVLTHCNAGALATAGHGTALGVIRSAVEAGKKISVIVDETRPFLQGARLTAWEMVQDEIPTTLITDSMAGFMMSRGEVSAVVVGADRVAENGDVANKVGTYMVAVLAGRHKIPFYVACPLSTIDLSVKSGLDIPIEERDHSEVKGFGNICWAAQGVKIRNPSFDVTPVELITALITEKGVVYSPDVKKLHALFV
jgi:methylthioribose-1-phosphate isomerase